MDSAQSAPPLLLIALVSMSLVLLVLVFITTLRRP